MESNYSNREFEQFVKQNADQYRMFPSEKVWKGIHGTLHTRRRWYGIGLAFLLLLTGGAVTLVMRTYPVSKKQNFASFKPSTISTPAESKESNKSEDLVDELLPFDRQSGSNSNTSSVVAPVPQAKVFEISSIDQVVMGNPFSVLSDRPLDQPAVERQDVSTIINTSGRHYTNTIGLNISPADLNAPRAETKEAPATASPKGDDRKNALTAYLPYTIESVTNFYKAPPKHISWQIFVTPTVSYRKLGENKSFSGSSNYPFASLSNVNNAVTHKPDLGMQIGVMGRYPLSKKVRLRGGFQFNINRYDIKAFVYPGEVATINLDGGGNNTVSTWTNYRSQSGYKSDWLKNFYFSVSVPIGIELQVAGNKRTSVGIAGTIQPTYVIRDRAYLISTDYKNYAEVPWLIRHMNVSTGFETFVNYTKGKTKWQIGPQVRYQLLSSFQNKYPVKENLFDFGIKLGVTLNN